MLSNNFVSAGLKYNSYTDPVAAPIFRKSFVANSSDTAKLTIGATGFYDLFLNGEKITDGFLAPYISNPDEIIFYDEYELSGRLADGENVIAVMLGNGFANPVGGQIWQHDKDRSSAPSFALDFVCDSFSFDARDMKWSYSHILFDDLRCGVYCDMTREIKGWNLCGLDDSTWNAPTERCYSHAEKRVRICEPVRSVRTIKPVCLRKGELRDYRMRDELVNMLYNGKTIMGKTPTCGGYIFDFGENISGVPHLKIKGFCGQKIEMQFCEIMFEGFADYINVDVYPDGCCQKDIYICSGVGEEEFIPPFTYHGFRYCYIYGVTAEQVTEDLITALVLHNDVQQKANFECSDKISNQIFAACLRSDLSNILHIITDCPHREKNGWTGDAAISAQHMMQQLALEKVFQDWLSCFRAAQDDCGRLPLVVPSGKDRFDFPVWDSAIIFLPYYAYIYSGNKEIIIENAEAMIKNFKFHLTNKDERGIIDKGYGDWLPVDCSAASYASPVGFCCSAILLEESRMLDVMLSVVGMYEMAQFARDEGKSLRDAIRREYNDNGIITEGKNKKYHKPTYRPCQTSQVLALAFGIFEEDEIDNAIKALVRFIFEKDNSFDCGFLGMRYIFRVLSEHGYSDLAYEMITKPSYPSYANMIYRGETTVWERFVAPGERTGSHNHHFMADVSGWYIESVAGIIVNPDKNNADLVKIDPHFVSALDRACAEYKTPNGAVKTEWNRKENIIELFVVTSGEVKVSFSDRLLCDKNVIIQLNGNFF
ncbi:MAG: hypothetical protein E7656_04935 [Ruminococcaceae bacterium]|nr:hypothetical protein [Oscillospiraceae bacterium]